MNALELGLDYEASKFWWDVVKGLCALAAAVIGVWWTRRQAINRAQESLEQKLSQTREDFTKQLDVVKSELSEKLTDVKTDVARIEKEVEALPSHDDIGRVYTRVNDVHGDVRELKGVMQANNRILENMNTHLINSSTGARG